VVPRPHQPDALARDHGISRATGYRYVDEVIAVLADQAPDLHQALERAKDEGLAHVILDGKVIPCDRCKEPALSVKGQVIDLWYAGKAHAHGGNVQAVLAPSGFPLWISDAEPGSVHDPHRRPHPRPARSVPGGRGAAAHARRSGLRRRGHRRPDSRQTAHRRPGTRYRYPHPQRHPALSALPRERGFALLNQRWRTLQHITASPSKIGDTTRAALVLTHFEHGYIT
jgi:hypothetical protein